MPVIEKIPLGEGQAVLWRPDEVLSVLLAQLSSRPDWQLRVADILLEKRKKEFLIPRIMLQDLCGAAADIDYSPEGKPLLQPSGSGYVSISHTAGCMALAFHPSCPVGIDVERISPRILRVAPRVMSHQELAFVQPEQQLIHQLLVWSAKESLFKALGESEIDFREHLHIEPFSPADSGSFDAWESKTDRHTPYKIYYKVYAGFVFTYCIRA